MSIKNENQHYEKSLPITAGAVALGIGWLKYRYQILLFYVHYRIAIAFVISCIVFAILIKVLDKIEKARAPGDLEKHVLRESKDEDSVFMGFTDKGKRVYFKESMRRKHISATGTTDAGKSESVTIPLSIHDMKKGRGLIIIDGKSDFSLIDKIYAYARAYDREHDVRILSICNPEISQTFNPLAGGTPLEITERVFKALTFENEYYKNIQYTTLLQTLLIFEAAKIKPTPLKVVEALRSKERIKHLATLTQVPALIEWATEQFSLSREEREQRTSGLITQLQVMTVGELAPIFNAEDPAINMDEAFSARHIIYCQLPVGKIPTLGKSIGRLVLQCVQGAVASRHLDRNKSREFFSVYLDDFTEYLTEGFVTLLNKSRSANVGIVFAHQAIGDLATLGEPIKNSILTNANVKVFMKTNEPDSAEYFAKTIGTIETAKVTERQKSGAFGHTKTGEGSVREAEEFRVHPNVFKQELGAGDAVVILPHNRGSLPVRMHFRMLPDLDPYELPRIKKPVPQSLPPLPTDTDAPTVPDGSTVPSGSPAPDSMSGGMVDEAKKNNGEAA